jgi:hypothetical protein
MHLFLSSQIKYTRTTRDTLLILGCSLFLLFCKTREALFKEGILLCSLSQNLALLQREDDQLELKKRWAWDSSVFWQRGQIGSEERNRSRSLIRSLPNIASHREKLCLGRDHCSQTTLAHWTGSTLYLKKSYALVVKEPDLDCQLESNCCTGATPPHRSIILLRREKIDFHRGELVFLASKG